MTKKQWTERQKKMLVSGGVLLFFVLMGLTVLVLGKPILQLADDPAAFRQWLDTRGWYGWILFLLMVIVQVFAAVIPGEPLEIAAGYAFGAVRGSLVCLVGEAIGGVLVFLFVKRFGMQVVETFFPRDKIHALRFLHDPKKRDTLFFLLFLLPGTPKDLLCYFAGLTDISLVRWCLIQTIGRLPSILSSTWGGNALGEANYVTAIVILAVTACVSGLGLLLYRHISRHANHVHDHPMWDTQETDTK